jgi:hypothetical protein
LQWILGLIATVALVVLVVGGYRVVNRFHSRKPQPAAAGQATSPKAVTSQEANATADAPPAISSSQVPALATVRGLRHSTKTGFTAIVVDLDRPVSVRPAALRNPDRLYFDLLDTRIAEELTPPSKIKTFDISDKLVSRVRMAQHESTVARVVLDLNCACQYAFVVSQSPPYRLVIDVEGQWHGLPIVPESRATLP